MWRRGLAGAGFTDGVAEWLPLRGLGERCIFFLPTLISHGGCLFARGGSDLQPVLERNVGDLSGGELQRFAIAVVAVQEADIYMFDEPSSYLDVKQRLKAAQVRSFFVPPRTLRRPRKRAWPRRCVPGTLGVAGEANSLAPLGRVWACEVGLIGGSRPGRE